jgi:hypothetical protein
MVNISFNDKTMDILKSLVGKTFESFECDSFIYSPTVYGIVGLCINSKTYKITCDFKSIQRFFHQEDVAVLQFEECQPSDIMSKMVDGKMNNNPIKDVIKGIDVINDTESVIHEKEEGSVCSTKGLIFHFASGNELSFEVSTWFSELITIQKGYELISKFAPVSDFLEEWDVDSGYNPNCEREVIAI